MRWVEFIGGPYDGGFGGLSEEATYPLPVYSVPDSWGEMKVDGSYAPGSPPEFCLDLQACVLAAGGENEGRKLLNSGVVKVIYSPAKKAEPA
jgi:hypothetical protein